MAKGPKCLGIGRASNRSIGQREGNAWASAGCGIRRMERMVCLDIYRVGDREMHRGEGQCLGIGWVGMGGWGGGGGHTCPLTVANGPFGNPPCLLSSLLP